VSLRTFRGGAHPPEHKELTSHKNIAPLPLPQQVVIPLQQHIGAPCAPTISKGDSVTRGQVIGQADAFVSAPVHASISGTVKAIEPRRMADGRMVQSVVIDSDGEDLVAEDIAGHDGVDALSAAQIKEMVRKAGIVGMGGAAFPTHVKYSPPPDVRITTVILNGCECEPYLTCDHRLMVEEPESVVDGMRAIMKVTGAERGLVGIESNKPDALEAMRKAARSHDFEVVSLEVKYPQGAEKQLISALTGWEVPSGKLPFHIGVIVNNVGTAAAISQAIRTGMPLVERVVTVSGDAVANPGNFLVRLGTPIEELISAAGGLTTAPGRIVLGGPMMGLGIYDLSVPVVKGTSGVLALKPETAVGVSTAPCIRCGRCVEACPMMLMPLWMARYPHESALSYNPLDCIECGSCSYVCPARRPLVEMIRLAKAEAMARRRAAAG